MCLSINILSSLVNSAVALHLSSSGQEWILVQFAVWKAFVVQQEVEMNADSATLEFSLIC